MTLGILGGGQLAQMLIQAAISFGIDTAIFERTPDTPAARLTQHAWVGAWTDQENLSQFAALCECITLENEFVDVAVLEQLTTLGVHVFPTSETLALIQDKLIQKQTMAAAGIALPAFAGVESQQAVLAAGEAMGYPLVLKARRDGYDGYGNVTLHAPAEVRAGWAKLGGDAGRRLLVEAFVPFERELAVLVVRGRDGEVRTYPVVETVQQNHICHVVRAPAHIPPQTAQAAIDLAVLAVETVRGVGVFGVELFMMAGGAVLYNEIAPRPHNSGHYTIEACVTSQFENHLRAVLGMPLGDTAMTVPAAVMLNVLGTRTGAAHPSAAWGALATSGAHVHLYGKREVRVGRKMGHVTVVAATLNEAESRARQAVAQIDF